VAQGFQSPRVRLCVLSAEGLEVTDGERGLGQTDVVAHRLERVGGGARLDDGRLDLRIGRRSVDPAGQQLNRSSKRVALRARGARLFDCFREQGLGLLGPAGIRERGAQVGDQIEAARVTGPAGAPPPVPGDPPT
jgi:hypothetical protein